ncbi:MAG: PKD domain-containing protein, partial [Mycobacteriales bacterium]
YQVGGALGTWVTGLRIGHLLLLSEPGEFYPSIHQAWNRSIRGAAGVFVIGMAQDQLGYVYPMYSFPSALYSADEQIFNPSLTLGDQVVTAGEQVARRLGFRASLTTTAEATALNNDYLQATRPGVQFLPFPRTGDLSPTTGTFTTLLEGISSNPRFSPATVCHPPLGLPGLPTCPSAIPQPAMGPYSWNFGDGTTGTSPPGTPQADPWFAHTYSAPGRYLVTARASDGQGASAEMSLALHVYPALAVAIARHGGTYDARVSGGSGHVLVYRWSLPDGASAWGPQIPAPSVPGTLTLTVTDSTGTMSTATTTAGGGGQGGDGQGNGGVHHGGGPHHGGGAHRGGGSAPGASYWVGAAKESITPSDLTNFYLGGYGIGPVHPATGVLRPIYARAIAIRDRAGHQVVIAAIDVQGQFLAYQQGPYGFADIAAAIHRRFGIPVANIVLESIHTHNGPDDLGVWGGVPNSYLSFVAAQTEKAIATAISSERRAYLRWATADMAGFCGTFGPNSGSSHLGDIARYPVDNQLRVLQAVTPSGQVSATLVNFSCHPTIYGPLGKISPDWPGATATYLEHSEQDVPAGVAYGYPGSVAIVTVGAVGRTRPRGTPAGTQPALHPDPSTDNNYPADHFGNSVARQAIAALATPHYLKTSVVAGSLRRIAVVNDNPLLAAFIAAPVPGYHIYRADTPPYGAGDVYVTWAVALRIGDLAVMSAPGEPYPSILSTLARRVNTPAVFLIGLGEDQLGYIEPFSDFRSAMTCSLTDEGFFTLSPLFGHQLMSAQMANARALGFQVTGSGRTVGLGPGRLPPSTDCASQLPGQVVNQLPVPVPALP